MVHNFLITISRVMSEKIACKCISKENLIDLQ